ncbi:DNA-binding protein [candidate division TA06 bacterium SM23_40]|uniref:Lon protease n=1 Tax=candidate division TA06 bacterium SM23_40 TaxID=1703774 RepID=A0A0S8GGW1_UNCT6|nr:MAG: DNA-binding protein [candidate division TA06 bacterium SM23_40]
MPREEESTMRSIAREGEIIEINEALPLLPLRDIVIFPYMIIPLLVGRPASVMAIEEAMMENKIIFLVSQLDPEVSDIGPEDLHSVGTIARLIQLLRLPDNTIKVLVEGLARAEIKRFLPSEEGAQRVKLTPLTREVVSGVEIEALHRSVKAQFEEYVKLNRKIPSEILLSISHVEDVDRLVDVISAHMILKVREKQRLLEARTIESQLRALSKLLASELEILRLEKKIEGEVKTQVRQNQRQFYLHEQLKAIRKELGYPEGDSEEVEELAEAIAAAGMPPEVQEKAEKELRKLAKMPPLSPEATVSRNYLDWFISVPWETRTKDNLKLGHAEKVLEADHYGLDKPKERILEYLAVLKMVKKMKGQILCFVGPAGTGKTSLGKSIARAIGRKFVRISLGGVRDEAEIRGHRRTYIGALPGRIIQSMKRAGTKNPVFLLDEVDKLGADWRGDPSAALLEVLDPEQNFAFGDHYLDVDFDLSEVLFICTANVLHSVPPALQDRMEVIRFPGYLEHEKLEIAKRYLVPKQLEAHGLKGKVTYFSEAALRTIIQEYTREAGVRNLEREIATISRKIARQIASGKGQKSFRLTKGSVGRFLGPPRFQRRRIDFREKPGVATGLVWTEVGGDIIAVEVAVMPGRGRLVLTGKLGEVMQESAQAALSYARSRAAQYGIHPQFYRRLDIHVHIPEGAIPKDGPSAGITIATALVSALTGIPVRPDVGLTGEITLRGQVLPIGGLAEKMVAAQSAGLAQVILPRGNEKDLKELPSQAKRGIRTVLVDEVDDVLRLALTATPKRDTVEEMPAAYTH